MRRASLLWALAVGALAVALFARSAGYGFAHDDTPLLLKNPFLQDPGNLGRFFRSDYWAPTLVSGLYRPLVTASYAANAALGGLDPLGFHLVNIALHAAVSVLVLGLVLRLSDDVALAAATGLLFTAHAAHTEVVANVTAGRPELMAALFLLLSLHAQLADRPRSAVAAFGLALFCKESAVAWIGIAFLTDWLRGRLGPRSGRLYAGYLAAVLAYVGVRLLALGLDQNIPPPRTLDNPLVALDPGWRILNALAVLIRYALLLLVPWRLSYDYSFDQIPLIEGLDLRALGVLATVLAGSVLLAAAARRDRLLFYALAFPLIALSVVSNLALPIGTIMAERLLYVPSIGFCLALAYALRRIAGGRVRVFAALVGVLVLLHGARVQARIGVWQDEDTLWLHDVQVVPRSARAQSNAGAVLERRGRCPEALERFQAAIAIGLPPERFVHPYQGKVVCLVELGRFEEAAALYEIVVQHGPPHPELERRIRRGLREGLADREGPP